MHWAAATLLGCAACWDVQPAGMFSLLGCAACWDVQPATNQELFFSNVRKIGKISKFV
jgi:hypothetical protein